MKRMKFFAAIFAVLMAMVACEPIDPNQGQGGNNTTTTEYGKGTEAEPYTVAGVVKTATGEAWVKGYIVGFMQTGDSNYPVFTAETDTINTNTLLPKDLHQIRIRGSFYSKVFLETLVPRKCFFEATGVLTNSFFVINMEGRGICFYNFLNLLFGHKRNFLICHLYNNLSKKG
jgi:hypothetical protein